MRLAALACALVIVACVAVFGTVLSQKSSVPMASPSPAQAASDQGGPRTVVRTVDEQIVAPVAIPTVKPDASSDPTPAAPTVLAQGPAARAAAPAPTPAVAPPASTASCPGNPNALGIARVVEIDTTGGPGFGFEHFKSHDFLRQGEVVLTFDDGPWPKNTAAVLAALAEQCTKAIFFPIGKHAMWEPGILKQVAAAGHVIGSHTWSHQDLSKKTFQDAKDEIEKGFSAVRWAVGAPTAPYFRFPALRHPPELVTYLGERNIGIFSTDFDSFDFKMRKPEQVKQAVLAKLKKFGKGMVLMHDFQHATAEAASDLLKELKAAGYKIVLMKPKLEAKTIASYDEAILKDAKLPTVDSRPTSSVVRTISE